MTAGARPSVSAPAASGGTSKSVTVTLPVSAPDRAVSSVCPGLNVHGPTNDGDAPIVPDAASEPSALRTYTVPAGPLPTARLKRPWRGTASEYTVRVMTSRSYDSSSHPLNISSEVCSLQPTAASGRGF